MGLVHQHSQGHRLWPNLYGGGTQGIRSLQRVPPLNAFGALGTPTDGNMEPSYPSAPQDLFLVLHLHPLHRQRPTAVRTLCGNWHLDLLVYVLRDGPAVVLAVGRSGLTPRAFGVTFESAAGKRSGLAPGGALGQFQVLTLRNCSFSSWIRSNSLCR